MEYLLNNQHCCGPAHIKCQACRMPLYYVPIEDSNDEIKWVCINCRGHDILQCNSEEACNTLMKIMKTIPHQLVALTLNNLLNSLNRYNSLSQPAILDNPIEILNTIFEKSRNTFKLGGSNVVIVADICKSTYSSTLFPILYLADTYCQKATRYYLHALRSDLTLDIKNNHDKIATLLIELITVANQVIKTDSYLLLGPTLQTLIPPQYYSDKQYRFNLRAIVPLTELRMFETRHQIDSSATNTATNIEDGFQKIIEPVLAICSIVNTLLMRSINKYKTQDELWAATQKYLTTAIWLRLFSGTPFESFLYHIINDDTDTDEQTVSD